MNDHLKGLLLTSAGVMAIVPDSILIRLIDAPHLTVVFWRAAFTGATILAGLALYHRHALPSVFTRLGPTGLVYALLFSLGTCLFVLAVQLTTIAKAVLIVSGTPVFAALFSRIFLGEALSLRMAATIAACIFGVAVITLDGAGGAGGHLGELCALGTAMTLAATLTMARAVRHVSMIPAAGLAYLITTLATAPFAAPATMQGTDFAYAALLGCVFIAAGTCLLTLGPRYIASAEVSLLLLLEAVFAPVLAWFVLDEVPTLRTLAGGAIIIAALVASNALALVRTPHAQR